MLAAGVELEFIAHRGPQRRLEGIAVGVALPHRTLGEEPGAVVHCAPGQEASELELQDWVREHLAAFKVPVRIVFSDDTLPRNANGKILKGELKALFEPAA